MHLSPYHIGTNDLQVGNVLSRQGLVSFSQTLYYYPKIPIASISYGIKALSVQYDLVFYLFVNRKVYLGIILLFLHFASFWRFPREFLVDAITIF